MELLATNLHKVPLAATCGSATTPTCLSRAWAGFCNLLDSAPFGCSVLSAPSPEHTCQTDYTRRRVDWVSPKHVTSPNEADMLRRQKTLACLHEELGTLALFDRVHDYATVPDPASNLAYASRQIRRLQIMAEIRELSASKRESRNHARISSVVIVLCAVGYTALHYLLK
jgi:hypothetical protein